MHGSSLKHSPPPETRETLKVLEELEKPDMGGMDPAVEKLRHEDFKFEASLGNFMSSRPAELQQGNCTQNAEERKICIGGLVSGTHLNSTTHKARLGYKKVLVPREPGEDKAF